MCEAAIERIHPAVAPEIAFKRVHVAIGFADLNPREREKERDSL